MMMFQVEVVAVAIKHQKINLKTSEFRANIALNFFRYSN